jgi:hypothetical protein
MARLEFIETEMRLDEADASVIRWHTPIKEWLYIKGVPGSLEVGESVATTWEPKREGADLEPFEVAQYFNEAETFFKDRPAPRTVDWYCSGYFYDFDYNLYLGKTDQSVCDLCGKSTEGETHRHGCLRYLFTWSASACKKCANDKGPGQRGEGSIFDRFPFPISLVNHHSIFEWHERHCLEHQFIEDYRAKRKSWAQG